MLNPLDLEVIQLDVFVEGGKVVSARSSGNRLRNYEKMFINKDSRKLHEIIPRVLATCAQSHVRAYSKAISNLGDTTDLASKVMVMLEIIESHVKHPYVYWFPYLGDKRYNFPSGERFTKISRLSRRIKTLMEKIGGKWPSIDYLREGQKLTIKKEEIREVISEWEKEVIGMDVESFLELKEVEELRGDLALLKKVPLWRAGLGNYLVVGFPFDGEFNVNLIKDHGLTVKYASKLVEVGPLAQALTFDEMIKSLHARYGPSPLLRELARMKVAAYLLSKLKEIELDSLAEGFTINKGEGVGVVESIRGSLIHKVVINDEYFVSNYSVIQPTTFNASPSGALEKAVEGLPVNDAKNPWEIALAVSSLDSCFITEVRVHEGEKLLYTKRIGGFC